jgi:CAP12/Pycsar effector protein, TIR domain
MNKPSVFIGSSMESLPFARAIRSRLVDDAEGTVWDELFTDIGSTFIETIINSVPRSDFAILVLSPDDLIESRNDQKFGPRDNVVFELGAFMGRLGRSRALVVHQADARIKIPTDLSGVVTAQYHWSRIYPHPVPLSEAVQAQLEELTSRYACSAGARCLRGRRVRGTIATTKPQSDLHVIGLERSFATSDFLMRRHPDGSKSSPKNKSAKLGNWQRSKVSKPRMAAALMNWKSLRKTCWRS